MVARGAHGAGRCACGREDAKSGGGVNYSIGALHGNGVVSRQTQAYVYAGCAVLLWSTVASAFKVSLRYVEAPHMLLYAALVSTAVLFVVAAWQHKLGQAFSCSPKQYLRSAALGFLNPFLYYLVLFEAYDRLPAQEAICWASVSATRSARPWRSAAR